MVHEHPRSFAAEEGKLLLLQGAVEIHVEPCLHPLLDRRSAYRTLIQQDVVRADFVPGAVPLQYFMNIA